MAPRKPPKPSCPPHDYRLTDETNGWITHTCRRCGDTITRKQGRMSRADVACLLVAVLIFAAGLTPIWLAARVTP
jgi:hypothetical protein